MSRAAVDDVDLTPEERERAQAFLRVVIDLLAKNQITPMWRSQVCVYIAAGLPPRVVGRTSMAKELRLDGLDGLAHDVLRKKTTLNEVLVLVVTDTVTNCWAMRLEYVPDGKPWTIVPSDSAILELLG